MSKKQIRKEMALRMWRQLPLDYLLLTFGAGMLGASVAVDFLSIALSREPDLFAIVMRYAAALGATIGCTIRMIAESRKQQMDSSAQQAE